MLNPGVFIAFVVHSDLSNLKWENLLDRKFAVPFLKVTPRILPRIPGPC